MTSNTLRSARINAHESPRRHLSRLMAAVLAAAAMVLGSALPASAYQNNNWVMDHDWTQSHIYTYWKDGTTYNTKITVQHIHSAPVCNFKAKASGTRSNGTSYSTTFGANSGCVALVGSSSTAPNVYFKAGSRLTGRFTEGSDVRAPVGINV